MLTFYALAKGALLPIHLLATLAYGMGGGIAALPIAVPLVALAERYGLRHPFAYLVASPFIFIATTLIGFSLIVFTPLAAFVGPPDERISDRLLLCGYMVSTLVAVGTYWCLRGHRSGLNR